MNMVDWNGMTVRMHGLTVFVVCVVCCVCGG